MNLSARFLFDSADEIYSRSSQESDPGSRSLRPRSKTLRIFLPILLVLGLAACTGGAAPTDPPNPAPAKTSECASYQQELRACLSAVGAPLSAADTFASTLAQSDDAERLQLEADCARDRVRLRASCR